MTSEEVLDAIMVDETLDEDLDDPEEPMMEGSDDNFSDLGEEGESDEDMDAEQDYQPPTVSPPTSPTPTTPLSNPADLLSSSSTLHLPPQWSCDLKPVTIKPFTAPVGPTVDVPETPIGIFSLFFSSDLLDDIVEESNRYAKEVLGTATHERARKASGRF